MLKPSDFPVLFAGTVMAATGTNFDNAVQELQKIGSDYGVRSGGIVSSIDCMGWIQQAIDNIKEKQ